jgi:hypothetical protein
MGVGVFVGVCVGVGSGVFVGVCVAVGSGVFVGTGVAVQTEAVIVAISLSEGLQATDSRAMEIIRKIIDKVRNICQPPCTTIMF